MSGEVYREQEPEIFREFAETQYAQWVTELARTVHSPLWIEDVEGREIVAAETTEAPCGNAGNADPPHTDAGSADRAGDRTRDPIPAEDCARWPIQAGDTVYGQVAYRAGDPGAEILAHHLAEQIGRHFVTVIDLDHMTGQLADSFDEINLLYRFSKILRPDAGILTTFRNLMAETADLLAGRILVLLDARKKHFEWAVAGGTELNSVQEWLIENRGELEVLFATVVGSSHRDGFPARIPGGFDSPHGEIKFVLSPVRTGEELTGYVGLFRKDTELFFETGELRLLECLSEELSNATTLAPPVSRAARHAVQHGQESGGRRRRQGRVHPGSFRAGVRGRHHAG